LPYLTNCSTNVAITVEVKKGRACLMGGSEFSEFKNSLLQREGYRKSKVAMQ
jgi:hypothetical protein